MKKCPNCSYLWPDEHTGQCVECGNPMAGTPANGNGDLAFRYARQVADAKREDAIEGSIRSARSPRAQTEAYDRIKVGEPIMGKAREMIVQTGEVEYEDDGQG